MPSGETTPILEQDGAENSDEVVGKSGNINTVEEETILTCSGSHLVCKSIEVSATKTSPLVKSNKLSITVEVKKPKPIRNLECLMHLLKGMIGTGILAMPVAFKNGGLWVSFVVIFVIGIICTHCMYILVECGNVICKRTGDKHLDFASVLEKAFETGSSRLSAHGKAARNFINAFLLITQFGFCCVYTVFVAQNVEQVFEYWFHWGLNSKIYIVIISTLLVPYAMVKSLKALAPCSTFANIVNSVGLVLVLVNLFQGLPSVTKRPAFGGLETLPLFFGQAIFAFEGIGLVLPLHNKMREKEAFLGRVGVLNLGLTITICLYVAVGFYGFLKYGDDARGSVTLNLPNDVLYQIVKLMFAVSLFISYGLQFYVPVNIIWPFITQKMVERNRVLPNYSEYLFRFGLVVCTCGLSSLVPHLDLLISLVGAFASSFLALIIPPIIQLATYAQPSKWMVVKDLFIIIIGLVGFATGTYSSVKEIIESF